MRVITGGGAVIAIGTVEAAPTIGIIDYSRRETDAFGVTTVVQRGFARQMSVRVKIASDQVDSVQRQIAALRATPATWIADDRFDSLAINGFFKDFSIDLAVPPVSYCTLTIEGLAEEGAFIDPGTDPAPDQRASTLRLLQPLEVNSAMLASSNIPEADHAEWSSGATYARGARVIMAATHRIYESAAAGNVGNDPAGASGLWIDIGPTNRWAMFDQALGSLTTADSVITLTLTPGQAVNALALLDVIATTVRVQTGAYDRTSVPSAAPGMVTFLDMPSEVAPVTVTIAGAGGVSVGTMLIGSLVGLGVTEAAPTAGITDYSRKETDGFGETTLVERAWAKRMNVRGLISTAAVDVVAGRISAVRARPSLWIGHDSLESVTVYGFFKDFSIEVGDSVSILSLSIEGLSKSAKIAPIVDAGDVAYEDGTPIEVLKPATPNATAGARDDDPVGGTTAATVIAALLALGSVTEPDQIVTGARALITRTQNHALALYDAQLLGEDRKARWERLTHLDGIEVTTRVRQEVIERINGDTAIVEMVNEIEATATDGIAAAMAAISDEASVRASADTAETLERELAISLVQTRIDDEVIDIQAAIVSEATTRATNDAAEATLREALAASVATDIADANAAILNEATVRATDDEAEATAREALAASLASDIADVSAAVESEATARAAEDGALASLLTTVQTTVDGNTASVLMLLEAVDGLNAKWGVRLDVDGYITGVVLNNDGDEGSFDVLADSFRVVSPGGGDRYEYSDGTQRIIAGSVMTVYGVAFGSTEQFIEWTGPIQASLEDCTEANAIKYVRVDGSAYFGGGLSSGTLKNEGASSTVDPAAFIVVGPFASNGEPVNVNMSAAFTHSYNCDPGTGGITGTGGGTVTLEWSSDGTSWTLLTSIGVNETERLVVVDGDPVVPDFVSWSMAAAGTYTWTPGALSGVHIRLRWTSFSEPTLLGTTIINTEKSQRTSVIAVEQP